MPPRPRARPSARSRPNARQVQWLARQARKGYAWAAYLLAAHANKVLLAMLQRAHPDVPWKNIAAAGRLT
jgi:hypothetical protein